MKNEVKKAKIPSSHVPFKFNPADFEPDFEEKLPRRFKEALNPPKLMSKKERKVKEEEEQNSKRMTPEEEWIQVRPGETFPLYNARIKAGEKPFTVPPKIIQTTPDFVDDTVPITGSMRKKRRKEYLRAKKKSGKANDDKDTIGNDTSQRRPLFIDTVKEPAKITSKPKEKYKMNQQKHVPMRHIIDTAGSGSLGERFGNRQGGNKHGNRQFGTKNSGNAEKGRRPIKAKRYFELVKPEQHP